LAWENAVWPVVTFLVVLAKKQLFGMFYKHVCSELKLLVFSAFLSFIEAV